MAGRHAPSRQAATAPAKRPRATRRKRNPLASIGAAFVAIMLAASIGIPVTAASASFAGGAGHALHGQGLTVSGNAALVTVTRDGSTIGKVLGKPGPSIANLDGWAEPIGVPITSGYGPRASICTAGGCSSSFHKGDDFAAVCGTPFYAAAAGVVTSAGYAGTDGEMIVVQHANGISTAYAHMFDTGVLVGVGDKILAGQNIGLVGSSGDSTGCHLYFEYRVDGVQVDPVPAMAAHGIALG
ncbi:MAG: M23 family metallopeptidase [Actinomycetota bacterium]